jgi:hypothetical protein
MATTPPDNEVRYISFKPPAQEEELSLTGIENMISTIAATAPISLEIYNDSSGIQFGIRTANASATRRQIQTHYPQAIVDVETDDPLKLHEDEEVVVKVLHVDGPESLPLRISSDANNENDTGSDPIIALIGALSDVQENERVVTRLLINPLAHNWSQKYHQDVISGSGGSNEIGRSQEMEIARKKDTDKRTQTNVGATQIGVGWLLLGFIIFIGFLIYQEYASGEVLMPILKLVGLTAAIAVGGFVYLKFMRKDQTYYDPSMVAARVSGAGYRSEIQIYAFLKHSDSTSDDENLFPEEWSWPWDDSHIPIGAQVRDLTERIIDAYRHYDNPLGCRLLEKKELTEIPRQLMALNINRLLNSGPSTLGIREVAALWHPPTGVKGIHAIERTESKALAPPAYAITDGAPVGSSVVGPQHVIRFDEDLMRRHMFFLARTRMGKSTLMNHVATHAMKMKARGEHKNAIVVIDPHADLVDALLHNVPPEIANKVRLIELGDNNRTPGVNLLDTRIFTDRDTTTDGVLRVAHGLWMEFWGPRMQNILGHAVKSLYEANQYAQPRDEQYTLLDALLLLENPPEGSYKTKDMYSANQFRHDVYSKVRDPYLRRWWDDFEKWPERLQAEAVAPIETRLGEYASAKKTRAILGQPYCTIDVKEAIENGDILLVSTAMPHVGRDVAALVGASVLNLVDAVIRAQGQKRPEDRVGAMVIVDEIQSIPGVEYEAMMSELGKFGGSLVLATQSLSKLDDISESMRNTIFSNAGCLCVFQVSGADARELTWELGKERITEDDITSQPVYHCYVRAIAAGKRAPTYSMKVLPPVSGDRHMMEFVRERSELYTQRNYDVERIMDDRLINQRIKEGTSKGGLQNRIEGKNGTRNQTAEDNRRFIAKNNPDASSQDLAEKLKEEMAEAQNV